MEKKETCGCMCHKTVPCLIILIGLFVLLGNFNVISPMVVTTLWSACLILIGLKKMFSCSCC